MMGAQRFWLSDFPDAKEVRLYLDEDPKAAAQEIADSKGAAVQSTGVCFYVFADGVLSVFVMARLTRNHASQNNAFLESLATAAKQSCVEPRGECPGWSCPAFVARAALEHACGDKSRAQELYDAADPCNVASS